MTWIQSLVIGLLTAGVGGLGAGLVATRCVSWYRIRSLNDVAGHHVVVIAILGAILGLAGGIVCSRYGPVTDGALFLNGLGVATGSMGGFLLAVLLVCRLAADLPPELDGHSLELAVEIRCPEGFTFPVELDEYGAFAGVHLPHGRQQPTGRIRFDEAKQVEGRWVVPATVPLETTADVKYLRAFFNQENDGIFGLPLARHPSHRDLGWSRWVEADWNADQPEPASEKKFKLRYRVQKIAPPPYGPTPEATAAAEPATFDAILAGAPVIAWLPCTRPHPQRLAAGCRAAHHGKGGFRGGVPRNHGAFTGAHAG